MNFLDKFKAARRVSTPLIAVRTPDPAAAMARIAKTTNGDPILRWDIASGLIGLNEIGEKAAAHIAGSDPDMMMNPQLVLKAALGLQGGPEENKSHGSILFFLNVQRFLTDPVVVQAIWNLRDDFKQNGRSLVMLSTEVTFPPELAQDVIIFDEPFPDDEQLLGIIKDAYQTVALPAPKPEKAQPIVAALRGLAAFPAEQVAFMCLTKEGMNLAECWERKFTVVEETPSLGVWRKKVTYKDVEGLAHSKDFFNGLFNGEEPPDVIVFMDEIEKMFAQGDLSGSSQQQHGAILKWMQNKNVLGVMFVGHPGAAKTALAQAIAGQFNRPMITFDVDAAQGSLIGQTGEQTRNALKVIDAMGRVIVVATCNAVSTLSPELRRRFQLGTFFFDLPTAQERNAIWKLYLKHYNLSNFTVKSSGDPIAALLPDDEGWTGADIKTCCDLAWRMKKNLKDVAGFVVPVSRATPEKIEALRKQAVGKWISASTPGTYQLPQAAVPSGRRAMGNS